jgi:hypothetical protein
MSLAPEAHILDPKLYGASASARTGHGILADAEEKEKRHAGEVGHGPIMTRMVRCIPGRRRLNGGDRNGKLWLGSWVVIAVTFEEMSERQI